MTYPNWVFSVFSFAGFLGCAIPFAWHLEAWNTGTCLWMFWLGIGCLNFFINSIVWNSNAINWAPVWCDISSKFIVGVGFAVPAASLCITRRLYRIASIKTVVVTKAEKRRAVYVDLSIGVGIPIIGMVLHYVVQGHRFNIYEDVGCFPYVYPSIVALAIMYGPTLLMGLISAYYAVRTILEFNKSRAQFKELLSGHSNLTTTRYLRLMVLSGLEVLANVPMTIYFIVINSDPKQLRVYDSWASVHWGFSRVDQFPAFLWRKSQRLELGIESTRWLVVICALNFFVFFGFADEARKNYRSAISSLAKRVGMSTSWASSSGGGSSGSGSFGGSNGGVKAKVSRARAAHPIEVHKEMLRRSDADSIASFNFADAGGLLSSPSSDEKKGSSITSFSPTQSYGGITLNDVGGALEVKDDVLAGASPISETATLSVPSPVEKAHTHDVV